MFNLNNLIRENIRNLEPYSSARSEYSGNAKVWLDANENPYNNGLNRYPDPYQKELKKIIAQQKKVMIDQIFIGNGSDEIIDLLFRAFCKPAEDKAYIFSPTYGMYQVSANINDIEIVNIELSDNFYLPNNEEINKKITSKGLLFICSPNNPTGNAYSKNKIKKIANSFEGLVVIDEAYIDFSKVDSTISLIDELPNIIVLQTLSKAYGLAGIRVGIGFSNPKVIEVLNKIKPPYNINSLSQAKAIETLKNDKIVKQQIKKIISEREKLKKSLTQLNNVLKVYPSEANFILVKFKNAKMIFKTLQKEGIIIRDRSQQIENCLRLTVGTLDENKFLIETLKNIKI